MKTPNIGKDSQVQSLQDFDIHHRDTNDILARSHDSLLLNFKQKTISDKFSRICISSLCHLMLAFVFCSFVILLMPKYLAQGLSLIILIITFLITVRIEYRKPDLWQRTEWLDFKTRNWVKCMKYLDGNLPTNTQSIPTDNLILVCFKETRGEEFPETFYQVGLCEESELAILRAGRTPSLLNTLQYTNTEETALAFTKELALRWKIPAWRGYLAGTISSSPQVQQLYS